MASTPLFDLSRIDLTAPPIAGPDQLKSLLRQRGTFEMLDGVLHQDAEEQIIVGYKDIRADDWWTQDHIPGRPIFPGALMIETGAQLCSYDYLCRMGDTGERFLGFGGLNNTRFRGVVEPGVRMYFVGKVNRMRSTMFTYFTQGIVEDKIVFEAEVIGVAF
ncbi:MAG: hypothetical protein H6831_15860 [Planctomycetes bacterium]|nr:hypothetical protein [Planctomycetota bacterium]